MRTSPYYSPLWFRSPFAAHRQEAHAGSSRVSEGNGLEASSTRERGSPRGGAREALLPSGLSRCQVPPWCDNLGSSSLFTGNLAQALPPGHPDAHVVQWQQSTLTLLSGSPMRPASSGPGCGAAGRGRCRPSRSRLVGRGAGTAPSENGWWDRGLADLTPGTCSQLPF